MSEMRYSIYSATTEVIQQAGGTNIKRTKRLNIVFATLDDSAVSRLRSQGYAPAPVQDVKALPVTPPRPVAAAPTFTPETLLALVGFDRIRAMFDPPLSGEGVNVAVLDTGIRETHELINGRVVYSKNYTDDPVADDFDHGTGVASLIVAIAPKCNILNMKVLDSKGHGTEEQIAMALDDLVAMHDEGNRVPKINLSLGSPDDGNPTNPVRIACRELLERHDYVLAAAGNDGPSPGTSLIPAVEDYVNAIGSCNLDPDTAQFYVSEFSSRGPTLEGITKPNQSMFGENIIVASSISDTATTARSGTSFACAQATGVGAMMIEAKAKQAALISKEYPHLAETVRWAYQQIDSPFWYQDEFLPQITIKPPGVPPDQDNDYGWGVPYAPLALEVFEKFVRSIVMTDITTMMAPLMSVVMLGVVTSVVKEMI